MSVQVRLPAATIPAVPAVKVPFNRVLPVGREKRYVNEAIASGYLAGDGVFTRRVERLLEAELGVPRVLLTSSCTHALEMSALLLGITPGDEVVVPSFTFVSTVNAFVLRGARPVFVDIRADTLNLDEDQLEAAISARTRAIVPVHYAGVPCEMASLTEIAERHRVPVVEDSAHALFARYRGRFTGTFGALAAQSFHETKNFTSGEGGALLINDESLVEQAEIIREKGTDRSRFFRGEVDKYGWVGVGSSYLMSDLQAAFLLGQLEARVKVQSRRRQIWRRYAAALRVWAVEQGVQLPVVPPDCDTAYHLYHLLLPSLEARQRFIAHLKSRGMMAVFHYLPLHLSAMGRNYGYASGDFPVTESTSDRLVRLPLFNGLAEADQAAVIDAVLAFGR